MTGCVWHCDCPARWHSIVNIWNDSWFVFLGGTEKLHFYNCTNFCLQLHKFFYNCTICAQLHTKKTPGVASFPKVPKRCPEKSTFSMTPLSFDALSPENPANIRISLILPETRVIGLHFCCLQCGYIFIQIFVVGSEKKHLFSNGMHIGRSRWSKVVDFGTNRKGVCDFLLVVNSNFGPIFHRFWDTASYWLKIANFSYPTLI